MSLPTGTVPLGPLPPKAEPKIEIEKPVITYEPPQAEPEVKKTVQYIPGLTLAEVEKTYIISALEHHCNNKAKVAKALGITVKTLYNRIHAYGLFDQYKTLFDRDPRGRKAQS